jgi:lipopolysaccharide transport system permease protein
VVQPVLTMIVFTTLFRLLGRVPVTEGTPYAVSLYVALLPWQLFADSLDRSANSLAASQALITKVYFPRLIIPIAPSFSAIFDFFIAFGVLIALMLWYRITPGPQLVALPFLIALAVAAALSVSIWFSALTALYRDFRYIVPFVVRIGMFISPVVFETAALNLEEKVGAWAWLYYLNPMAGVIEGFRWALLDKAEPPWAAMGLSVVLVAFLGLAGTAFFRRMERTFADLV